MPKTYLLFLDDSGTRHPNRSPGKKAKHGYDWFALGGVLLAESDEAELRERHKSFMEEWALDVPLHSSEIRARASSFSFITTWDPEKQARFYEELYCLMRDIPAIGMACVIDRAGYRKRYEEQYGRDNQWMLCKSAFSIIVERAAKYVAELDGRLRVLVEESDKKTDQMMAEYYGRLRAEGMPFSAERSAKYNPLSPDQMQKTLFEFRKKKKSSPLIQFADLFLWPICMGGYNPECRPYARLIGDHKIIDCLLENEGRRAVGVKYYCFDNKKPGS